MTVPLPGTSADVKNATVAAIEEFVVPSDATVTAHASTSEVPVQLHQIDDMETDMEDLVSFIQSNEIPEVSDTFAASVFSPGGDDLATSVSNNFLYHFLSTLAMTVELVLKKPGHFHIFAGE